MCFRISNTDAEADCHIQRGGGRSGQSRGGTERTPKKDVVRYNEKYCKYYDSLNLVPKEEKEALWKFMGRDLPNSFRFTGSKASVLILRLLQCISR